MLKRKVHVPATAEILCHGLYQKLPVEATKPRAMFVIGQELCCVVPSRHYCARLMRFGSRGPFAKMH